MFLEMVTLSIFLIHTLLFVVNTYKDVLFLSVEVLTLHAYPCSTVSEVHSTTSELMTV